MEPVLSRAAALLLGVCLSIPGQVIEFESNGLKYQTITKGGVTLMVAHLPGHVRELSILQVAVSNGSPGPYTIRPEDFSYKKDDGTELHAWPARDVVQMLREKGGRNQSTADSLPAGRLLLWSLCLMEQSPGLRMLANSGPVLLFVLPAMGIPCASQPGSAVVRTHTYLISLERRAWWESTRSHFHE